MSGLFDGTFARGGAAGAVSDDAWFRALFEAEAALARAAARSAGAHHGGRCRHRGCADPSRLDLATVVAKAADAGNPVPPLVRALQDAVGERDAVAVHVGATSQDVLDTALVLLARQRDLRARRRPRDRVADAAARLAAEHRDEVVMGRTLMQQALPTTFGLKAAGWLAGLDGARLRLAEVVALAARAVRRCRRHARGQRRLRRRRPDGVRSRARPRGLRGRLAHGPVPIADLAGALGATAGVIARWPSTSC